MSIETSKEAQNANMSSYDKPDEADKALVSLVPISVSKNDSASSLSEKASVITKDCSSLQSAKPDVSLVSTQKVNVIKQILPHPPAKSEGKIAPSCSTSLILTKMSDSNGKSEKEMNQASLMSSGHDKESRPSGSDQQYPTKHSIINLSSASSSSPVLTSSLTTDISTSSGGSEKCTAVNNSLNDSDPIIKSESLPAEPQNTSQTHQTLTQALAQPLRQSIIFHHGYDDLGLPSVHPTGTTSFETMRTVGEVSHSAPNMTGHHETEINETTKPAPPPVATATVIRAPPEEFLLSSENYNAPPPVMPIYASPHGYLQQHNAPNFQMIPHGHGFHIMGPAAMGHPGNPMSMYPRGDELGYPPNPMDRMQNRQWPRPTLHLSERGKDLQFNDISFI